MNTLKKTVTFNPKESSLTKTDTTYENRHCPLTLLTPPLSQDLIIILGSKKVDTVGLVVESTVKTKEPLPPSLGRQTYVLFTYCGSEVCLQNLMSCTGT